MNVPVDPVEIIDIAEPERRPVSPNLFLNIVILLVIAGFVGCVGVALMISGTSKI